MLKIKSWGTSTDEIIQYTTLQSSIPTLHDSLRNTNYVSPEKYDPFLYIPQETNVSNLNVSSPSPPAVGNPSSVPPSNIFWTNAKNNVNKHAPRLAIGASTCYWSVYGTPNRPNSYISCPPLGNCTYCVRRGRQDEDDGCCWWCQSQHWIRPHLGYYLAWAILWLFPYCWGAFP